MRHGIEDFFESLPLGYVYGKILQNDTGELCDYVFLEMNKVFEELMGFKREEVWRRPIRQYMLHGKKQDQDWIMLYESVQGGETQEFDQYSPVLDRWYRVTVCSPEELHFSAFFMDVTAEWYEIEKRQILLDSLKPIVMEISKEGCFLQAWFSHHKEESAPSLVGKHIREVLPSFHADLLLCAMEEAERTDVQQEVEYEAPFGDLQRVYKAEVFCIKIDKQPHRYIVVIHDITEQKERQEALEEQREELERFFRVNLDLLCIADMTGRFIKLNKAWEEVLGYSLAELEGAPFMEYVHPEEKEKTLQRMEDFREDSSVMSFVNRYRAKDGTYRSIEWRSHRYEDRLYASARDVTRRLKEKADLEKLLSCSEQYLKYPEDAFDYDAVASDLRAISGALFASLMVLNRDRDSYEVMSLSGSEKSLKALEKHVGYDMKGAFWSGPTMRQRAMGSGSFRISGLSELTGGRISPFQDERMQRAFGVGEIVGVPINFGEEILGFFILVFARDKEVDNWNVIHMVSRQVGLILTRNASRRALLEERNRYERLTSNAAEAVFLFDAERPRVLYVNPAGEEILGYTAQEYERDFDFQAVLLDETSTRLALRLYSRIVKGKSEKEQATIGWRAKDGRVVYLEHTVMPVRNSQGKIIACESLGRDITEARALEEALRARDDLLSKLTKRVPGMIYQLRSRADNSQEFLYTSDGVFEIYGVTPKEARENADFLLGRIVAEQQQEVLEGMKKAQQEGRVWRAEYRVRPSAEKEIWVRAEASPEVQKEGVLWSGYITDITQYKKLQQDLLRRYEAERLLSGISSCFVHSSSEYKEDLLQALSLLGAFLELERISLFVTSFDNQRIHLLERYEKSPSKEARPLGFLSLESLSFFLDQIKDGLPLGVTDVMRLPEKARQELDALVQGERQSLMLVPLRGASLLGFLLLESVFAPRELTLEIQNLLIVVGEVFSSVLKRKYAEETIQQYAEELESRGIELEGLYQKLDEEISKARDIHERVRQKTLPRVRDFVVEAYHRPALTIGGDFYNVIHKDNKLVLYFSDVTGHGLDGALLSSFVKNTLSTYVYLASAPMLSPWKMASHLYERMCEEDFPLDYAVAIFIGVLDLSSKVLRYTAAGLQTPPLHLESTGLITKLVSFGLPITNSVEYYQLDLKESHMVFSSDAKVLLSTDGLYDQRVKDQYYQRRLQELLRKNASLPCKATVDLIHNDLLEFLGSKEQDDDVTFMVLQQGGEATYKNTFATSFLALSALRTKLTELLLGLEGTDDFVLGVHELAANAIEHGNQLNENKNFSVEIYVLDDFFVATIEDEGQGFDWTLKKYAPVDLFLDSERGRGIAMTQMFGGRIVYNKTGNRASLIVDRVPSLHRL